MWMVKIMYIWSCDYTKQYIKNHQWSHILKPQVKLECKSSTLYSITGNDILIRIVQHLLKKIAFFLYSGRVLGLTLTWPSSTSERIRFFISGKQRGDQKSKIFLWRKGGQQQRIWWQKEPKIWVRFEVFASYLECRAFIFASQLFGYEFPKQDRLLWWFICWSRVILIMIFGYSWCLVRLLFKVIIDRTFSISFILKTC